MPILTRAERAGEDMSETGDQRESFVPTSFEDLRRDTRSSRADILLREDRQTSHDLHDLVAERGFMRNSRLIAGGAAAIGALLILIAYARPLFDTFNAFGTAGQVAADKAGQQLNAVRGAVGGIAGQAALVKQTDEKAINTAKGGLACLTGKASCPNGSSPVR